MEADVSCVKMLEPESYIAYSDYILARKNISMTIP